MCERGTKKKREAIEIKGEREREIERELGRERVRKLTAIETERQC